MDGRTWFSRVELPHAQNAMTKPKVSVVIASFNAAAYLPETIESVLRQDYTDFELLIVDDASRDGSREVLARYAAADARVRYRVNPTNVGAVANWNRCLDWASGDYVKFLCCDDFLAADHALSQMVYMLETHPGAVLTASARRVVNERSEPVGIADAVGQAGLMSGADIAVRCLEANANLIGEPSAVLCRRRCATRGYLPAFLAIGDLELWFHLLGQGDFVYTRDPLCAFRRHSLQMSQVLNRLDTGSQIPDSIDYVPGQRQPAAEADLLLRDYYRKPWLNGHLSPRALFVQLYYLRKRRTGTPGMTEIERDMQDRLGRGRYAAGWLAHKLRKPLQSLARAATRRRLRRPAGRE